VHNSSNSWFESLSTARAPRLRLFCFPYGGGNAYVVREWQRHFAPEIDVCLVHLPGRARRIGERPHTRLRPLVQEMADRSAQSFAAVCLYGHSMGALLSFELARELRRRNYTTPVRLFLSALPGPECGEICAVRLSTFPSRNSWLRSEKLKGTPKEFFEFPELQNGAFAFAASGTSRSHDTYEYLAESPLPVQYRITEGEQDELATVKSLAPGSYRHRQDTTLDCFLGTTSSFKVRRQSLSGFFAKDYFTPCPCHKNLRYSLT